jgi:hypothetical protein
VYDLKIDDISYFYLGWLITPEEISTATSVEIRTEKGFSSRTNPLFRCKVCEHHIEVYCSDIIPSCESWINDHNEKTFTVIFPGCKPLTSVFKSSSCAICAGIHWDSLCPVSSNSGSRKRGIDDLDDIHRTKWSRLSNVFRRNVSDGSQHPVLEREILVEKIITRAKDRKILLVSRPGPGSIAIVAFT